MSLATLKMIEAAIVKVNVSLQFDEHCGNYVVDCDEVVNMLNDIHTHLKTSLERDGLTFVDNPEDKS